MTPLRPGLADRLGRAHAEGLRLLATAWTEAYQARFEGPALGSGADQRTAMELAAQLGGDFLPLGDPAPLGIYRRQQELAWTEHLVERIESELEAAGVLGRPERVPAMAFLDLVGYTHLTEQRGDGAATTLAAPSTWPPASPPTPAPARSWSASAWPTRPHPRACALWSWGSYRSRGSPVRCGC